MKMSALGMQNQAENRFLETAEFQTMESLAELGNALAQLYRANIESLNQESWYQLVSKESAE